MSSFGINHLQNQQLAQNAFNNQKKAAGQTASGVAVSQPTGGAGQQNLAPLQHRVDQIAFDVRNLHVKLDQILIALNRQGGQSLDMKAAAASVAAAAQQIRPKI